jgi:uncharacterized SAM-binding protein YcdF (DUF218 family)
MARAWIVNDPLTNADVILVIGGGPDTRPLAAVQLFRQGLAPKILLTKPEYGGATALGLLPDGVEIERRMMVKEQVPAGDILVVPRVVDSTYDEAAAVAEWARTNSIKRVIIPTDLFHTRRVRWIFRRELRALGIEVIVRAVPVLRYAETDWWRHEQGIVDFQNEFLKDIYYHWKY